MAVNDSNARRYAGLELPFFLAGVVVCLFVASVAVVTAALAAIACCRLAAVAVWGGSSIDNCAGAEPFANKPTVVSEYRSRIVLRTKTLEMWIRVAGNRDKKQVHSGRDRQKERKRERERERERERGTRDAQRKGVGDSSSSKVSTNRLGVFWARKMPFFDAAIIGQNAVPYFWPCFLEFLLGPVCLCWVPP